MMAMPCSHLGISNMQQSLIVTDLVFGLVKGPEDVEVSDEVTL